MAYPVSAEFATETTTTTQRAIGRIDITDPNGQVLYSSVATVTGEVTEDSTRAVRRSCTATFVDRDGDLTPRGANDLLAPLGNEMRIYRGLYIARSGATFSDAYTDVYDDVYGELIGAYQGIADEWVPLGVFGIARPTVSTKDGGVTITIQGYDRARRIQRARLTDSYAIASGTDLDAAIGALLNDRWPDVPSLVSMAPAATLAANAFYDAETDPWEAAQTLAEAHGTELLFDETGVPVRRSIPDPATQAVVATYTRDLSGLMTDVERSLDDEQTYSGVVVTGESTSGTAPVRATVWDDDPNSPTWRLGKFGQVPIFYTSPFITTSAQALTTAASLLPRYTGILESAEWVQVPNAALQAGDLVQATDETIGLTGAFSLESVTTGLRAGMEQQVRTKARRLVQL